jgi:hypothetical protein
MTIFWSIFFLVILVGEYASLAMKFQVNERLSANERLSWFSPDSRLVIRKYKAFYPDSRLPLVAQGSFWIFIGLAAIFFLSGLWKSN